MQGYREMVFEGSLEQVKAFLTGLQLGRGWSAPFCFCDERGVAAESRGHKLLETLHLEKDVTHVIVSERQAAAVRAATQAARPLLGLRMRVERAVQTAEFRYEFATYARPVASRLRRALADRPVAVTLRDCQEHEEEHPEAHGAEGYAPAHEYEFRGSGVVEGPFADVLALHDRLARLEWVQLTKLSLRSGGR